MSPISTTSPELPWRSRHVRRLTLDRARLREAAPFALLLGLTAFIYLWALSRNGWANPYYAAAVQAGTKSWKAVLFGSLDAANYITVDKPPASLWLMELSGRVFGFSSFSMLLPQALEGVAAVALLYTTVRRWFGRPAALLAEFVLALTPVAALMFSFNNPDALLVLLLVAAAYALTRAIERGTTLWLLLCAVALGFAFLTKDLQAFLILPAFALAYLVAAPVSLRRRIGQLVAAGMALVLSGGWWVALVELWPAGSRPYIGGSTNNSVLQLIIGYNGLNRISSGGAGDPGGGFSGAAGVLRLFNAELGGQISWLLPAAAIVLVLGAVWTARRARTDRTRAALLIWGGWLVLSATVFSLMTGTIHPYYTNTLAPPIAVLVGVGTLALWRRRDQLVGRLALGAMLAATGVWSFLLLDRTASWHPWLRFAILAGTVAAAAGIAAGPRLRDRARTSMAVVGLTAALAGPLAFTLSGVAFAHTGSNPTAGPAVASAGGFGGPPGGGGGASGAARPGGGSSSGGAQAENPGLTSLLEKHSSRYLWAAATTSAQNAASMELATGKSVMAIGGFTGSDPAITLARFEKLVAQGKIHYYIAGGAGGGAGGGGGGVGALAAGPGGARAGTSPAGGAFGGPGPGFAGAPGAAGVPGGASGSVGRHLGPGGFGGLGGGSGQAANSQIATWVEQHFRSSTVGGTTVYDLSQPKAA